jgi:hypothetical protein
MQTQAKSMKQSNWGPLVLGVFGVALIWLSMTCAMQKHANQVAARETICVALATK